MTLPYRVVAVILATWAVSGCSSSDDMDGGADLITGDDAAVPDQAVAIDAPAPDLTFVCHGTGNSCQAPGDCCHNVCKGGFCSAPPANFGAPTMLPVDPDPVAIALADFDGDQRLDFATANTAFGTVTVRLNSGGGKFPRTDISSANGVNSSTYYVLAGDVDADQATDLLVCGSNGVAVLYGAGNGTFGAPQLIALDPDAGIADNANHGALADLDGDGRLDVATAPGVGGANVSIYFNLGNRSFGVSQLALPAWRLAIADLNGNGRVDVAAVNNTENIGWVPNLGNRNFAPATTITGMQGAQFFALASADFDGDGLTDLAALDNSLDSVTVLRNQGNGAFVTALRYDVGSRPASLVFTDLDGDGLPDVATANNGSQDLTLLLNDGRGGFGPAQTIAGGSGPYAIAAGDLDGDGRIDLAVTDNEGSDVSIFYQQ